MKQQSNLNIDTLLPRMRGRPAKLSPTRIVSTTRELLATMPPEQVTLALVAERLQVPPTSVYNYFANRDALMRAVAEQVFANFEFKESPIGTPWQDALLAWLRAVDQLFHRHPIAFQVVAIEGRLLPAWIEVRAPLLRILRREGLRGRALAFAASTLHSQVMGLLFLEQYAAATRARAAHEAEEADPDEAELRRHYPSISHSDVVEYCFGALVHGLQDLISKS